MIERYRLEKDLVKAVNAARPILRRKFKLEIWRQNTGALKQNKRFIRFGIVGAADFTGIMKGKRVEIECKAAKGKQSDNQKAFQKMIEKHSGIYILAYSVQDIIEALEKE